MRATLTDVAGADYSYAFGELSGTPPMRLDQGTANQKGLHMTEVDADFWLPPATTQTYYAIPTMWAQTVGGNWSVVPAFQAGVRPWPQFQIGDGFPGDLLYLFFTDIPGYINLETVNVNWTLAGGAGVPANAVCTIYRVRNGVGSPPIKTETAHGTATKATFTNTLDNINAGSVNLVRATDYLVLVIQPANGGTHTNTYIHDIILTVTQFSANPWKCAL
jgi:hypothetical protein